MFTDTPVMRTFVRLLQTEGRRVKRQEEKPDFFLNVLLFIFEKETETQTEPKQAPGSRLRAVSTERGSNS